MYDKDKFLAETKCDTCGQQGVIGVASSSLGPISFAFCLECAHKPAEPEFMFVMAYWNSDKGEGVADWVRSMYTYDREEQKYVSWNDWVDYVRANPGAYLDPFEDLPEEAGFIDYGEFEDDAK